MTADGLPRYDAEAIADALAAADSADSSDSAAASIVGVVLAGGTSSRFGERNKLLAEVDGEPLVRRAAGTLLGADLAEVIVVLGHESEAVRTALADLDVRFVDNPAYDEGLSTSVARGVEAAGDADAALFLPGDMPAVDPETAALLVDAYRAGLATALAAAHDARRRNPVLFGATHFEALRSVDGDVGGREVLLEGDESALVETDDPGVVEDVDTTDDLRRHR